MYNRNDRLAAINLSLRATDNNYSNRDEINEMIMKRRLLWSHLPFGCQCDRQCAVATGDCSSETASKCLCRTVAWPGTGDDPREYPGIRDWSAPAFPGASIPWTGETFQLQRIGVNVGRLLELKGANYWGLAQIHNNNNNKTITIQKNPRKTSEPNNPQKTKLNLIYLLFPRNIGCSHVFP